MRLFIRTRTARPDRLLDARQHALELVRSITGDHAEVFAVRFGVPMGSTMWSVRVESEAHLQFDVGTTFVDGPHLDAISDMKQHDPLDEARACFVEFPGGTRIVGRLD